MKIMERDAEQIIASFIVLFEILNMKQEARKKTSQEYDETYEDKIEKIMPSTKE